MGTSEEGSKARNQSTLKKEEKISMMKTFGLLILICSILDIGISNPNKHFLVETSDIADGDEAKPATNINIKEASITMGENENGKGDYQNNVNQGPIATVNRFRHGQPGTITRPLPRPPQNRGGRPAVLNRCGGFLGLC